MLGTANEHCMLEDKLKPFLISPKLLIKYLMKTMSQIITLCNGLKIFERQNSIQWLLMEKVADLVHYFWQLQYVTRYSFSTLTNNIH